MKTFMVDINKKTKEQKTLKHKPSFFLKKNKSKKVFLFISGLFLIILISLVILFFIKKTTSPLENIQPYEQKEIINQVKITNNNPLSQNQNSSEYYNSKNLNISLIVPSNYYISEKDSSITITTWKPILSVFKKYDDYPDNEGYININYISLSDYTDLLISSVDSISYKENLLLNNGNEAKLISAYDTENDSYLHLISIDKNNLILLTTLKYSASSTQTTKDQLFQNYLKIVKSIEFTK